MSIPQAIFKKYGPSYQGAVLDLSVYASYMVGAYFLTWYFRNSILSIVTIPLLGLLFTRAFIIFHDCGHNSYTPSRTLNYALGMILGPVVFTPYLWNFVHATHHVASGRKNNEYGFAYMDIVITYNQYKEMSTWKRITAKCLMSPYILFTLLSNIIFMIYHRMYIMSFFLIKCVRTPSLSYLIADQIFHNLGLALLLYTYYQYGLMLHCLLSIGIGGIVGTLLFFNQHTYNPPYIADNDEWTMRESGLKGSSFIQIPWYLTYFTGGIEYHHIHHSNSRIPGYNLKALHNEVVSTSHAFDGIVKLTMSDCYKNLWLSVYDEDANRFITFEEADARISSD